MTVPVLTDWFDGLVGYPSGAIPGATGAGDEGICLGYWYRQNEIVGGDPTGNPRGQTVTLGTAAHAPEIIYQAHRAEVPNNGDANQAHHFYYWWGDTTIAAILALDGLFTINHSPGSGGNANNTFWDRAVFGNIDNGSFAHFTYDEDDGTSIENLTVSPLVSAAGAPQYAFGQSASTARTYGWAAPFVKMYQKESGGNNTAYTMGEHVPGGELAVTINKGGTSDDNMLLVSVISLLEAAPGVQINDVNGDDIVRINEITDETVLNQVNGQGFDSQVWDGAEIDGVPQASFLHVSDSLITFETVIAGAGADLQMQAGRTLTLKSAGGDLTHTVELAPETEQTYVNVAGLPWPPTAKSIFDGLSPAVADGDQCIYEVTTDLGFTVTINPDGVPQISGGGTASQKFMFSVWRAADASRWSPVITQFVNYTPVIVNIGVNDISDITDTNIPVDGDHFGASQLGSVFYLNQKDAGLDGNEVEQPIAAWNNEQITIANWVLGALPGGTEMQGIILVQ